MIPTYELWDEELEKMRKRCFACALLMVINRDEKHPILMLEHVWEHLVKEA